MEENMIDKGLLAEITNNDIIMESLMDMMLSQEGAAKRGYINIATEAIADPTKQGTLLNRLFKEIEKVDQIDFGKIPNSKGDLTKYVYYDQMHKCIVALNNMSEGNMTDNMKTMNKLHDIILSLRADFQFGFRTDNFCIMNTYNLMVASLYEMINVSVVDVTEYLRKKTSLRSKATKPNKNIRWITKTANMFIKMVESGQWSILMKGFKSPGKTPATEAGPIETAVGDIQYLGGQIKNLGGKNGAIANTFASGKNLLGSVWGSTFGKIGVVITLLLILRAAIYYFIGALGSLSDRLKNTIEILKVNTASESKPDALSKQEAALNGLSKISDTIDYKIIKSENSAKQIMTKSDRTDFSSEEIGSISGSDFEFDF